jgi:hypothetical protein
MQTTTHRVNGPPKHRAGRRNSRWSRRAIAATAIIALPLAATTSAFATTAVTEKNPNGITAVGPVNTDNGFPAWYQDKTGTRVELCLDKDNPMCGFLPGDIPDETKPIAFDTNFPEEAFYFLAGSSIDLPGGGKATLTLGLEAAFANTVTNGDQVVFARQRIFVVDGPTNTTLHFVHPYGKIDIDTDSTGKGRLTEDISPAAGNFTTALKGNIGPFLTWDTGPVQGAGGPKDLYVGDPALEHAIKPGPKGALFTADWTDSAGAAQHLQNDQFSLLGKISTNTGVHADAAVQTTDASGKNYIDVFASSEADADELFVSGGTAIKTTPMVSSSTDPGPKQFYARVEVTGTAPTSVSVKNVGDSPTSSSEVPVTKNTGIYITDASYDGAKLHVAASTTSGGTLSVSGTPLSDGAVDITTTAPPAQVTVTSSTGGSATAAVRVTGGAVTPEGEPPVPASTNTAPVCTILDPATGLENPGPCPDGQVPTSAAPTAKAATVAAPVALGDTVVLDASTSTNATSYEWAWVSGPQVQITNGTTAKPSVKLQPYDVTKYTAATAPKAKQPTPTVVKVTAANGTVKSTPVEVTIPVKTDDVATTSSRYRANTEIRVDGTSTVPGGSLVLNPATTVAVYAVYPATATAPLETRQLVGTANVDTAGAWSVRLRSTTGYAAFTTVDVVSSRGGYARFTGGATR